MWDLNSLTRDQTYALHWKHGILTTGLPGKSLECILFELLFNRSVVSNSLQPHGLQHSRLPCPPLSAGVCANSCPLSDGWCHPTMSSSVTHFSSCPQSFPASGSFRITQIVTSGGQSIGASASPSISSMSSQSWFLLWLTGLISLLSEGLSRVFSSITVRKHQFFGAQPSLWPNSHIHTWLLEKS